MKKTARIVLGLAAALAAAGGLAALLILYLMPRIIRPYVRYRQADYLYSLGRYEQAMAAFAELGDYRDSRTRIEAYERSLWEDAYDQADALFAAGSYGEAEAAFLALGDYRDSAQRAAACQQATLDRAYDEAQALFEAGNYEAAKAAFAALGSYGDSAARVQACELALRYGAALALYEAKNYEAAIDAFTALGSYGDSEQMVIACYQGYLTAAQADLKADRITKALENMARVDTARITLDQQIQLQKLYTGCGKALEDKGNYAAAFRLYEQTGSSFFQKDMDRCNEKYRTEPHRLSERCVSVDSITWQYAKKQITVTIRYDLKRDTDFIFKTVYNDGTEKEHKGTLRKKRKEQTFSFPYSEVSDPDRIRHIQLTLYIPFNMYADSYLGDTFAGADRDLYGEPIQ